jgi:hypothetical protein
MLSASDSPKVTGSWALAGAALSRTVTAASINDLRTKVLLGVAIYVPPSFDNIATL